MVVGVSYGSSEQGGRVREALGAPSGTGHSGRQFWPMVWYSEVVWCSEVVGCASGGHATTVALRARRASALLWRPWGLEGVYSVQGLGGGRGVCVSVLCLCA